MEETMKTYFERYQDNFLYYVDDNRKIWQETEEYKNTFNKIHELFSKYPNVDMFLNGAESAGVPKMTEEDLKIVREVLSLERDLQIIEQKEIFYLGRAEAYRDLNKMRFLKIEN